VRVIDVADGEVRSGIITMGRRSTPLRFVLFPMCHIASPSFYAEVRRLLAGCDLIVAEGVRGRSVQLRAITLAYRFAPRFRRWSLQLQDYETLLPPDVPVINPDVTAADLRSGLRQLPRREYGLLLMLAPLMGLMFAMLGPRPFIKYMAVELPTTLQPERHRAILRRDEMRHKGIAVDDPLTTALLATRDTVLIQALTAIHEQRQDEPIAVAVVYGAEHIPRIATNLMIYHGYRVRHTEYLTVF
jgi:hypothetical protein